MTFTKLAIALAFAALSMPAIAQYPDRPIHLIIPFAAASGTDQLARAMGQAITEDMKVPVVVENKPGASAMIGATYVAKSAPDGYTVLLTTNTTHAANEHLYKKLPYDPVKDFTPITTVATNGQIMLVNAQSPIKSVGDFIAEARRQPGKLTFGSGSSSSRVGGELLQQMTNIQIVHVPYKGNPQVVIDLLADRVTMMMGDPLTSPAHIRAGKLRALGVTGPTRMSILPDVPTIDQAGVKGYEITSWYGVYTSAGTPPAVVSRLNGIIHRAARSAIVSQFFKLTGLEIFLGTPGELAEHQKKETAKWGRIIKAANIEAE